MKANRAPFLRPCKPQLLQPRPSAPAKYRIAEVIGKADQPLLTMPIAEQSRVCRSTAGRILRIMELMGEVRNVGVKTKAKWERA